MEHGQGPFLVQRQSVPSVLEETSHLLRFSISACFNVKNHHIERYSAVLCLPITCIRILS